MRASWLAVATGLALAHADGQCGQVTHAGDATINVKYRDFNASFRDMNNAVGNCFGNFNFNKATTGMVNSTLGADRKPTCIFAVGVGTCSESNWNRLPSQSGCMLPPNGTATTSAEADFCLGFLSWYNDDLSVNYPVDGTLLLTYDPGGSGSPPTHTLIICWI